MSAGDRIVQEEAGASLSAVAVFRRIAQRIDAALAEREAQIAALVKELDQARVYRFNETTGCISWNRRSATEHPDRCRCQDETTPHKHYADPGNPCARCECNGYVPAIPTSTADAAARFQARVRAEEREGCIRAMCPWCRQGYELREVHTAQWKGEPWTHFKAGLPIDACHAAAIRALK